MVEAKTESFADTPDWKRMKEKIAQHYADADKPSHEIYICSIDPNKWVCPPFFYHFAFREDWEDKLSEAAGMELSFVVHHMKARLEGRRYAFNLYVKSLAESYKEEVNPWANKEEISMFLKLQGLRTC